MTLLSDDGHDVLARRTGSGALELPPEPVRVKWTFGELVTADGYDARCTFECSARAIDDPTERKMLREVLLHGGRQHVTAEDVSSHFESSLRATLGRLLETLPIADALGDAQRHAALHALRDTARRTAFACGLELLAPFHFDIESPSLQQARVRDLQRTAAERNTAEQLEHLQRAGELLKQFQSIRQSAPELSASQVLQQIAPADRGSVLQALLLASARQDNAVGLWAVAGPYLVRIDAAAAKTAKPELIPLPPTLGPLRSIQASRVNDQRVMLIGARSGFMIVRPDSPGEPEPYHDPDMASELGFSRVVYWAETQTFVACHGDAGIVGWTLGETARPRFSLRADQLRASYAGVPRNLHVLDPSRVVFSIGGKLIGMNASQDTFAIPTASDAEIVGVVPDDLRVLVAHEDGTVCAIDRSTLQIACKQRTGTRLRAAGALPWLGSTRLLLSSDDDAAIRCVGLDDPLVTQYASTHQGARVVAGSNDVVAAVSADRQRVLLWNTWDGREPIAEIYLTGATRHRVADVGFC